MFGKKNFDERKWKPIIVGAIVFAIVFAGLTLYQQVTGKDRGDVILKNAGNEAAEEGAVTVDGAGVFDEGDEGVSAAAAAGETEGIYPAGGDAGAENAAIFVDVNGAVNISGLFAMPQGSRVADAIEAAGGLTDNAEIKYINRAYILSDGDRLYIPTAAEVRDGTAPPTAGQVTASGGAVSSGGQNSTAPVLININTAGSDELQKLTGVGPVTAQKIIDYRTKRGGFKRIEDIMNVSGIGAKTFERLKDYIIV